MSEKSRQEVKSILKNATGFLSGLIGENSFVKPDCKDFADSHPGVEPPEVHSNRFLRQNKFRKGNTEVDD